jgi:hypothetical protein
VFQEQADNAELEQQQQQPLQYRKLLRFNLAWLEPVPLLGGKVVCPLQVLAKPNGSENVVSTVVVKKVCVV